MLMITKLYKVMIIVIVTTNSISAQNCSVCDGKTEGLVRYPTTLAPAHGVQTVYTQCADNADFTANSPVSCSSDGVWSTNNQPRCRCITGYREITATGRNRKICQAIPNCSEKYVGLVIYPTTPASQRKALRCADNAHLKAGFVLSAYCNSDGVWSQQSTTPECECDDGFRQITHNSKSFCEALPYCPAKRDGLVRYPATQAPISASLTVTVLCADNARKNGSLKAVCNSNGEWSSGTARCQCDRGYLAVNGVCEVRVCDQKYEGLVYYPTTFGNHWGNVVCIDHAVRIGTDVSVWCGSDGQWSSAQSPRCHCSEGYREAIQGERYICEAIPKCLAKADGLVQYPTTIAPVAAGSIRRVTVECADNAHNITNIDVGCTSAGSWTNTNSPQCECNDGFAKSLQGSRTLCKVIVCDHKYEGLVYYPTTFGNHWGNVTCIDHAIRIGTDISVWCGSDGLWSSAQNPECQCSEGYREAVHGGRYFCEAIPRCPAKSDGLVRYPTTLGGSTAELPCADNAHSNSSNMTVECDTNGTWSEHTTPECICDEAYRILTGDDTMICEAIPSCPSKSEGLVHYPTTRAPISGEYTVTLSCADNAIRDSSSLNVTCNRDGTWSGEIPRCKCDLEYYESDISEYRKICLARSPILCEAKSEGLVRYPNWLAPIIGYEVVETKCADNAHLVSSTLNVTCGSNGEWSGSIPLCECGEGYHVSTTADLDDTCQADNLMFTFQSLLTISSAGLLLLLLLTISITLLLCVLILQHKLSKTEHYNKHWIQRSNENIQSVELTNAKFCEQANLPKQDPSATPEVCTTRNIKESSLLVDNEVVNEGYTMETFPLTRREGSPRNIPVPILPLIELPNDYKEDDERTKLDENPEDSFADEEDSYDDYDATDGEEPKYLNTSIVCEYATVNHNFTTMEHHNIEQINHKHERAPPTKSNQPTPSCALQYDGIDIHLVKKTHSQVLTMHSATNNKGTMDLAADQPQISSDTKDSYITATTQQPQAYEYAVVTKKKSRSTQNHPENSENEVEVTIPLDKQPSSIVGLAAAEYDAIAKYRKIKKPRNIEDVEEIYDVVVDQLSHRTEPGGPKVKPYAIYTVPTIPELSMRETYYYEAQKEADLASNMEYTPSVAESMHSYDTLN